MMLLFTNTNFLYYIFVISDSKEHHLIVLHGVHIIF